MAACSHRGDSTTLEALPGICSLTSGPTTEDEFYSLDHRVEIEIDLAPADWELLRHEGRTVVGAFTRSQFDYSYTFVNASVTIDGKKYEDVAVRKKGYLGSLSVLRPSLIVDLNRNRRDQDHLGLSRFTLNNDRQDESHTHQCLAYRLFAQAGLPASRCNLARVIVNGTDLGTYSNIEPVKGAMLRRNFGSAKGNLYEGQLADFVRSDVNWLELKNNEDENDRSDLDELIRALEASDAELLSRLEPILDLNAFRDFWAMETLVGHWDGYANNSNNYLAYHVPDRDRFVFLPWGTDSAFEPNNPASRVYAKGKIANRLYALPSERQRFRKRLGELNDAVWDEQALLEAIDGIEALATDEDPSAIERMRAHVRGRSDRVRSALNGPAPQSSRRTTPPCWAMVGAIEGSFSTRWGTLDEISKSTGEFSASVTLDGRPAGTATWTGGAGFDAAAGDEVPRIRYLGVLPDERRIEFDLVIHPTLFSPGVHAFHGGETAGTLNFRGDDGLRFVGAIGDGQIRLTEASTTQAARVAGSFSGKTLQLGCAGL